MIVRARALAVVLVVSLLGATPAPRSTPSEAPIRPIAIAINGVDLEANPAPRIVGGHLLVPVVRIFSALGVGVQRDGATVVATTPRHVITFTTGSPNATIDKQSSHLEVAPVEIDGTTYVPLRFVADAIGAQVSYNPKAARVEIVSALLGRADVPRSVGGRIPITGTVTAIDRNSAPPSITITRGPSVRTIAVNSTAKIVLQDVVTKTQTDGTLESVQVGDALSILLNPDGLVQQITDLFASRTGTIAAVSPSAVVLDNGRVITPQRDTVITLNGQTARLADLKVGDSVTQRSNPETNETRSVIVSRRADASAATASASPSAAASATAASSASAPAISDVTSNAVRPFKPGETLEVTLTGTPGGKASFDIGSFVPNIAMREVKPGTYTGSYAIPPGVSFSKTPVFGHLTVAGVDASRFESKLPVSAAAVPPQITEVAPPPGQVVNNNRPSIFATFTTPTDAGVNPTTVTISVNGHDVTASATRTASFITYSPAVALEDGNVQVTVKCSDNAGNVATRAWTFAIKSK